MRRITMETEHCTGKIIVIKATQQPQSSDVIEDEASTSLLMTPTFEVSYFAGNKNGEQVNQKMSG